MLYLLNQGFALLNFEFKWMSMNICILWRKGIILHFCEAFIAIFKTISKVLVKGNMYLLGRKKAWQFIISISHEVFPMELLRFFFNIKISVLLGLMPVRNCCVLPKNTGDGRLCILSTCQTYLLEERGNFCGSWKKDFRILWQELFKENGLPGSMFIEDARIYMQKL